MWTYKLDKAAWMWTLERIPLRFEHSLHGERSSCTLLPRNRQRSVRSSVGARERPPRAFAPQCPIVFAERVRVTSSLNRRTRKRKQRMPCSVNCLVLIALGSHWGVGFAIVPTRRPHPGSRAGVSRSMSLQGSGVLLRQGDINRGR